MWTKVMLCAIPSSMQHLARKMKPLHVHRLCHYPLPCLVFLTTLISNALASDVYFEDAIEDGAYLRREHCLKKPYHGTGMDVPFWEFGGSTVVTSSYVRLTPDRQSKRGILWNTVPVGMHNWEVVVQFQVHGQGKTLFGDGFAFWYTKEKGQVGPVFGSKDYFVGLGIFFDTYSNHNGEHKHDHPYISSMVNDGTLHYDHDRDGTHGQMDGCTSKFRNSNYETYVTISYIDRVLSVLMNINGGQDWHTCFMVSDVDLPTGYYFGFSATTGDLADNHDIISVRVYDVDVDSKNEDPAVEQQDWSTVKPHAKKAEPPREHTEDVRPWFGPGTYQAIAIGLMIVLVLGILAVVGGVAFIKSQEKSRKRFF